MKITSLSLIGALLVSLLTFFTTPVAANDAPDFTPVIGLLQIPDNITLGAVSGVGVNSKGQIYIGHRAKQPLICFEANGRFVRSWGDDLIGTIHGLSIDADDNVWVTDTGHHVVYKFDPAGKLLLALGQLDKSGPGLDLLDKPTYAIVGPDREIIVAEGYGTNQRIMKFSPQGKYLSHWGKPGKEPGEFHSPHAMVIDAQGRLIVADRDNDRIQIFSRDGKLLKVWEDGYTPFGIALDPDGVLFVADGKQNKILQLDGAGKVVKSWGQKGVGSGEFNTTHLMTADNAGNLYIAEAGGKRMQKLERKR